MSGPAPTVPVTAIVTAYRRPAATLDTLARIDACVPRPAEILVHVDGNERACEEAVRRGFPAATVIVSDANVGPGGARNRLLDAAAQPLVASFDDDSYPLDADYFARVVALFDRFPDASVVDARVYHPGETVEPDRQAAEWVADFSGGACTYRREVFLRSGGYVPLPLAYGMEEVDLGLRLHASGARILRSSWLRVWHDTDRARHAHPDVTAASIVNLALLAALRYPVLMWPVGLGQLLNRVQWLLRNGRRRGVLAGLLRVPREVARHWRQRDPIPTPHVRSFLRLRRRARPADQSPVPASNVPDGWLAALYAIAGLSMAAALAVTVRQPMEPTMPVYGELAARLRAEAVTESFEPLGYPWLISLMPARDLDIAARQLHLAAFVMLVALVVATGKRYLRAAGGSTPHAALVVALCAGLLLHPYLLVNLVRLNDNNVNVLLLFGLFSVVQRRSGEAGAGWRPSSGALAGSILGLLIFVRPNAISLVPMLAVAPWLARTSSGAAAEWWKAGGAAGGAAVAAYVVLSVAATGGPAFWPSNGAYNLFAGNNPAALAELRAGYNAEPSIIDGLAWCGHETPPRAVPASGYVACAKRFAAGDPAEVVYLSGFKFYNMMFRSDLRRADSAGKRLLQHGLAALPVMWWTLTAVWFLRTRRLLDPAATVLVLLYAAPFAFTNSDPRFRLPLDAVYILSLLATAPGALLAARPGRVAAGARS